MRIRLQAETTVPCGLTGRVVLKRDNGPISDPSEVEWFDLSTITTAGGWAVPRTVNGFYYVLET